MDSSLREQRQEELANAWIDGGKFGIVLAAPRTGKCFIGIKVFNKLKPASILIAFPDGKIKQSWLDEFERVSYWHHNITFTTYLSLHKYKEQLFDIVVLDEIHTCSEAQLLACYELLKLNKVCLSLTGTLSNETRKTIKDTLGLPVLATYSIEKAIEEGVIADYEITVITVPLDNKNKLFNGKTEKQKFDNISWVIDKLNAEGKDTFFLKLQRMRIIQNSLAKKNKTISLLKEYEKERILVFCGVIKIADSLGIPSYHSKSSEKQLFEDFANGVGNHLAVCKIGNTGKTYKPLNRVIINYTDSNSSNLTQKVMRCTSMEYDNPDKKALITIVSTNEKIELDWIRKAVLPLEHSKIKYL